MNRQILTNALHTYLEIPAEPVEMDYMNLPQMGITIGSHTWKARFHNHHIIITSGSEVVACFAYQLVLGSTVLVRIH